MFAAFMLALAPLLASASEPLYLCPDGLGPFRPQKGADFCLPTLPSEGGVALPGQSDSYFDQNSAELSPLATAILDRLAPILCQHPAVLIDVYGHTDTVEAGTEAARLKLGLARAKAVMDYLISQGVRPDHIAALTRGSRANLLPDNPTDQVLAAARYVSIETRDAE